MRREAGFSPAIGASKLIRYMAARCSGRLAKERTKMDASWALAQLYLTGYDIPFTVPFQQSTDDPGEWDSSRDMGSSDQEVLRYEPRKWIFPGPEPEPAFLTVPRRGRRPRDEGPPPHDVEPRSGT
jgi:hypothetical protein